MTKSDLIDRIAQGTGLTRIETAAVINGFIATIKDALVRGERVDLRGFGAFKVQHRAARTARNPRTNEVVPLDAQYVPAFKPSKEWRDAVHDAHGAGTRGNAPSSP